MHTPLRAALILGLFASSAAFPLTWQHQNGADADTIALYHFNETSGGTSADSAGARTLTHSASGMHSSAAPGWLATPSGRYLECASNAYALYNTLDIAINWTKGLTISFWMRATDAGDRDATPIDLSRSSWQNRNYIRWRATWSNPYHPGVYDAGIIFDTSPGLRTKLLDGQWHHIGMTWDPADTMARFYIDNVFITNWLSSNNQYGSLATKLCVGGSSESIANYYVGDIDEVLIQNGVIYNFSDGYGSGPTNPVLAVSPTELTFAGEETQKVYQVANAGVGTLHWTNAVTSGAAWLSVSRVTGAQGGIVTATIDRVALAYGTHTGAVTVTANGDIAQEVVTVYAVHAPPQLVVSPATLDFGGVTTSMPVEIWNAGVGTVGWTAVPGEAWLGIAPAAGVAGAAHTGAVVTVNRAMLAAYNVYTGMVSFIPSYGATQTVAAVVSTYPTTGNALLRIHATRPGVEGLVCVRGIVRKADGTYLSANEWSNSSWPVVTIRGIAFTPDMVVTVPVGQTEVTVGKGPDYMPTTMVFNAAVPNALYTLDVALQPVFDMYSRGWRVGETHCHYFHGEGEISRTPTQMWRFASAGGMDFLSMGQDHYGAGTLSREQMLGVWKQFDGSECKMWDGNEEPKNLMGHFSPILYDPWSVRSAPPYFLGVHDVHRQGGVAYPNHPLRFYPGRTWVSGGVTNWFFYPNNNHFKEYALEVLVGHTIDGYSGCSDEATGNAIIPAYCTILNQGYKIPMLTESDVCFDRLNSGTHAPGGWMAYYYLGSNILCRASLADAMRKGRMMVTTGPMILFTIDGAMSGDTLPADGSNRTVRIEASSPFNSMTLGMSNFPGTQPCRINSIDLYRNGALLQSWTPNTPSAVVTRVISETATNAYYLVRVVGNDGVWRAGYASPIYFEAAPRPPRPRTYEPLIQGRLYDGLTGNAVTGTVSCVRYGDEYWRIATDSQGRFQAHTPIDAQLVARDGQGRAFTQDITQYEPSYSFLHYVSDSNQASGNMYVPQSLKDYTALVSTMRWEFPMGTQLAGSYAKTALPGEGVMDNFTIVNAPPAFPGNTHTEVVMVLLDKTQADVGDTINFACIYRQPLGTTPTEGLSLQVFGWNPEQPSAYNPFRFIGGPEGGQTSLGGGFYLLKSSVTIPAWVRSKGRFDGGIELRARVRQQVGGTAWLEEFSLTLPVGPAKRELLVSTVWDGVPGSWGSLGIGPCEWNRSSGRFQNRYADYRTMTVQLTLNGLP
ncbi:CehA/McbA family metallohydrolase, partial [bacterium]|nr:CehA/McbA family metallohydrolase [bacterium]